MSERQSVYEKELEKNRAAGVADLPAQEDAHLAAAQAARESGAPFFRKAAQIFRHTIAADACYLGEALRGR